MSNAKTVSVLAVGVGGQGIILMSDIIAEAAFQAGYDAKKSEIHGLSQRGGSVTSNIRWGGKVYSPVIMDGDADFILSLDRIEVLRYAHMVRPDGLILTNSGYVEPTSVKAGQAVIPDDLDEQIGSYAKLVKVDADAIALKLGNKKIVNTVMVGVLAKYVDIPEKVWMDVLWKSFPEKIRDINVAAFKAGIQV